MIEPVNSISDNWNDNLQSLNQEKMKHRYQSFARIGRQFQSLKRQVYAVWTSVSFPLCQRSYFMWRIMTNTLTNIDVVIFLSASFFGRSYHSRYQNFEFTGSNLLFIQCILKNCTGTEPFEFMTESRENSPRFLIFIIRK